VEEYDYANMTAQEYKALYERFQSHSAGDMLKATGVDFKGKTVIDLCTGFGYAALAAKEFGAAAVTGIDIVNFTSDELAKNGISFNLFDFVTNGEIVIPDSPGLSADIIVCRQAINYWVSLLRLEGVANRLNKGGVFIFNTFSKAPSSKPTVKQYTIGGREYAEIFYIDKRYVHHVQCIEGLYPHVTKFEFISRKEFHDMLKISFTSVKMSSVGNADIYCCYK